MKRPDLPGFEAIYRSEGKTAWNKFINRPWAVLQTEWLRCLPVPPENRPWLREAKLFWGQSMRVQFPDAVGIHLLRYGYFEQDMTRFFLNHLHPGDRFYDIGAHFGFFSLLAAALVNPDGRVVAVEPTPRTAVVLESNLAGMAGTQVLRCAAHETTGELTFTDYGIARSAFNSLHGDPAEDKGVRLTVEAVPLDTIVERTNVVPDVIKIDAERAESSILRGAAKTLREASPLITLEMGDADEKDGHSRALIEQMAEMGYQPHEIDAGGSLTPHRPQTHYGYTNLVFRRPSR